jgi:hypothetical protein
MNLDNNFPAPLQVLMFLGTATLAGILLLLTIYGLLRRKPWVRRPAAAFVAVIAIYFAILLTFSFASREKTLARGEEKYFCEIDCHLAYSIQGVERASTTMGTLVTVRLRTRFDEKTISLHRPKDASLTPAPREVQLVASNGTSFFPVGLSGMPIDVTVTTPINTPLKPGWSYMTTIQFEVPANSDHLRLLVTSPGGPVNLLIGNEMSFWHKKTFLSLE